MDKPYCVIIWDLSDNHPSTIECFTTQEERDEVYRHWILYRPKHLPIEVCKGLKRCMFMAEMMNNTLGNVELIDIYTSRGIAQHLRL